MVSQTLDSDVLATPQPLFLDEVLSPGPFVEESAGRLDLCVDVILEALDLERELCTRLVHRCEAIVREKVSRFSRSAERQVAILQSAFRKHHAAGGWL